MLLEKKKSNAVLLLSLFLSSFLVATSESRDLTDHNGTLHKSAAPKATTSWAVTATLSQKIVRETQGFASYYSLHETAVVIVHWVCFGSVYASANDTIGCCNAMHDALQRQRQQPEWLAWKLSDDDSGDLDEEISFVRYCQRKRAVLPTTYSEYFLPAMNSNQQRTARFSLVVSYSTAHNNSNDNNATRNLNYDHSALVFSPAQFVYDLETGHSFWKNGTNLGSMFELPDLSSTTTALKGQKGDDIYNYEKDHRPIECQLESYLSETGGMHRTMKHRISLLGGPTTTNTSADTYNNGQIHVILWIPHDMWFDANDAFPDNHETCIAHSQYDNVTCWAAADIINESGPTNVHGNNIVVMDIEDAAFDSPQHVVPVQIHYTVHGNDISSRASADAAASTNYSRDNRGLMVVLEVTTKLHFRYPKPAHVGSGSSVSGTKQPWRRVVLPTPSIHQVLLQEEVVKWQAVNQSTFAVTYVAVGYDDDYFVVMTMTMAWNILGSIILLRDILRVAYWR